MQKLPKTPTQRQPNAPLSSLLKFDKRLIFIRGGYSKLYDARYDDEPPQGGGSFNNHGEGWESNNFRDYEDHYYVYTRARANLPLNLQRLGAEPDADEIDRVMVIQVATHPERGQVVVGWFRGATAFADWQERPFASDESCAFIAPVAQAVLLPDEERKIPVPKGKDAMGQSQVRYASDASGRLQLTDWMLNILQAICHHESRLPPAPSPSETPPQSGQGRGLTALQRKAVENFAMTQAMAHFRALYDTIEDTHLKMPFDLLCSNRRGGPKLRVEVKGTTGDARTILVTRGEVDSAQTHPTALFIAFLKNLTWANKPTATLNPSAWQKTIINPWRPTPPELTPTAYEWHNPHTP